MIMAYERKVKKQVADTTVVEDVADVVVAPIEEVKVEAPIKKVEVKQKASTFDSEFNDAVSLRKKYLVGKLSTGVKTESVFIPSYNPLA